MSIDLLHFCETFLGDRELYSSVATVKYRLLLPFLPFPHFISDVGKMSKSQPAFYFLYFLPQPNFFFFFFVPIYAFFFFLGNIFLCKADYNTFTSWRPWSKRVWPLLFLWKICSGRRPTHLFITNSPLFSVGHSVLGLHERIGWSNS